MEIDSLALCSSIGYIVCAFQATIALNSPEYWNRGIIETRKMPGKRRLESSKYARYIEVCVITAFYIRMSHWTHRESKTIGCVCTCTHYYLLPKCESYEREMSLRRVRTGDATQMVQDADDLNFCHCWMCSNGVGRKTDKPEKW